MKDTIFCAAVTVVPVVVKMVCITQTMFSIPETTVCANEKIFLTAADHFPGRPEDGLRLCDHGLRLSD